MSGWKAVTDELPREGEMVLVATERHSFCLAYLKPGRFWRSRLGSEVTEVTHWLEIPPVPPVVKGWTLVEAELHEDETNGPCLVYEGMHYYPEE